MMRIGVKRMCLLLGAIAVSAVANALFYDATISIDRALNGPTITVRYSGASVALVELRVNGLSVGTRNVSPAKTSGETNFTLDLAAAKDGDNDMEVRLFDKAGKLVGVQKSSLTTDDGMRGPIFLSLPKVGATVQGPCEIKLGFGREMRNIFVSFFVDNQFKSMMNVPPYTYMWDTVRETNGWHEVEAWVVDDSSTTFKTKRVKVFVNNPGGNTPRQAPVQPVDLKPIANGVKGGAAVGKAAGMKGTEGVSSAATNPLKTVVPKTGGILSSNAIKGTVGSPSGAKSVAIPGAVAAGNRNLTPTGTRVAATPPIANVTSAAKLIPITYGQRLPNLPTYAIILNSKYVEFDVSPRVANGVPLTPFRHLMEGAGGTVNWENATKVVDAKAQGREIWLKIGDKIAKINSLPVQLELAPFIESGRTVVPLSFIRDTLNVNIEFDPTTGHVLITARK